MEGEERKGRWEEELGRVVREEGDAVVERAAFPLCWDGWLRIWSPGRQRAIIGKVKRENRKSLR